MPPELVEEVVKAPIIQGLNNVFDRWEDTQGVVKAPIIQGLNNLGGCIIRRPSCESPNNSGAEQLEVTWLEQTEL